VRLTPGRLVSRQGDNRFLDKRRNPVFQIRFGAGHLRQRPVATLLLQFLKPIEARSPSPSLALRPFKALETRQA
jgi:hypothetical protein